MDIPEPWYSAMVDAEIFGSYGVNKPTAAALARAAELPDSTIYKVLHGKTIYPSPDTIAKLAKALKLTKTQVMEMANVLTSTDDQDLAETTWILPPEAELLTYRERAAIEEVIRCYAATRRASWEQHVTKRQVRGRRPSK